MNNPKVFIGIITYDGKKYAEDLFFLHLTQLTYSNKLIVIVDNSDKDTYANHLKEYGYLVLKGPVRKDSRQRIVDSRNILREAFLRSDCEYFFSLESDVLPEIDVIERLMERDVEIVSAIYCFPSGAPIAYDYSFFSSDLRQRVRTEACRAKKLLKIKIIGLGAALIKREVIERVIFRFEEHASGTDDCWFSLDALNLGYNIYLDSNVRCKHFGAYFGMQEVIEFDKGRT
jgi:GT2 family glycosyltransferase